MRVRAVREKYQTCCIALLTYNKAEALYFPVQPERLRPVHHFIIIMALQAFTKMKNMYMVTRDRSTKSATFSNNNIYSFSCTNLSLVFRSVKSHNSSFSRILIELRIIFKENIE